MKILPLIALLFLSFHSKPKIALLFFNDCSGTVQQRIRSDVQKFYGCTVTIVPAKELPSFAYYSPRKRYRAEKLLTFLDTQVPSDYDKIIGVTTKDISTTSGSIYDWGVMGLGALNGRSSVMSTYRLTKGADETILYNRIMNTVLHEIGHTMNLEHCPTPGCLMNDAEGHLHPSDDKTPWLCQNCWKKIL